MHDDKLLFGSLCQTGAKREAGRVFIRVHDLIGCLCVKHDKFGKRFLSFLKQLIIYLQSDYGYWEDGFCSCYGSCTFSSSLFLFFVMTILPLSFVFDAD
ncbi:hypothetical protein L1987_55071 [Smallanthus sonchifolius]|uniref:Uncharacterized protein n=1 Tax=Smallanthus sonchifolius TaxID=185202 RepID=A0ACB9E9A7_9ASTR|nr:hypothetical protein L1987_55071 [Smallanthus sonchifolius]